MRRILALLLLLALAFSGCADDGDTDTDDTDDMEPVDQSPTPPASLEFSGLVPAGTAPSNFVDGVKCGPQDFCIRHAFTVNSTVTATLSLTWTNPANDFDLALDSGGSELAYAGAMPPGTEEIITATLQPGDYEAVVVPWLVVAGQYVLTIDFS